MGLCKTSRRVADHHWCTLGRIVPRVGGTLRHGDSRCQGDNAKTVGTKLLRQHARANSCAQIKAVLKLMPMTASYPASVISSTLSNTLIPTQLTSISQVPASAIARRAPAGVERSATMLRPPIAVRKPSRSARVRLIATTSAPRCAKSSAVARPMPLPAPVMMTDFQENCIGLSFTK